MKTHYVFILSVFVFTLMGCPNSDPASNPDLREKGYIKGMVTDGNGNPLSDVEIVIDNTTLPNSYLLGKTDEKGQYSIQLPNYASTYQAYAKLTKKYNGREYKLDMHPEDSQGFTQEGGIRNFQWRLTGKKPQPLTGTYGGFIQLDKAILSELYDVENIEFTLTPVGNLINGSAGEILQLKSGLPTTDTYSMLVDIPIGRYLVSAFYQSGTNRIPVKLRNRLNSTSAFTNSILIDFEPQVSFCFNCCNIEYKE